MVPLRHRLESGSTVEIMTSRSGRPSRDWLKFVVTQRAKSRIKQWIKTEERKQSVALGMRLLETELRKRGLGPKLLESEEMQEVLNKYNLQLLDDLFVAVGYGRISPRQAVNRLLPEQPQQPDQAVEPGPRAEKQVKEPEGITIKGIEGVLYHTAKCCSPIPGDRLMGFISRGKGVSVHRRDCSNLERLATDEARLVRVEWKPMKDISALARLLVITEDKPGVLANLTAVISSAGVNISRIEASTTQDLNSSIVFALEVKDREQLAGIMRKIAPTSGVHKVKRD